MKHIDDEIREVFAKKLSNAEADVSPHLWEAVQSQIAGSGAGTAASAAKVISMKVIVAASAAILAIASVVYFSIPEKTSPQAETKTPSNTIPQPAPELKPEVKDSHEAKPLSVERNGVNHEVNLEAGENSVVEDAPKPSIEKASSERSPEKIAQVAHSNSDPQEEKRLDSSVNDKDGGRMNEAAAPFTGVFKVLPIDINEMRYSFQSKDVANGYYWNFGDDTHSNEKSPNHRFAEEGNYEITLMVTDASGNQKTTTHEMNVYKPGKAIIPNVFTPNGDGSNDTFDPSVKSEGVTFTRIVVSDSQGRIVFESNGQPWDGNDPSGSPCNVGTYQYYVSGFDRNQEILENKDVVTLIR